MFHVDEGYKHLSEDYTKKMITRILLSVLLISSYCFAHEGHEHNSNAPPPTSFHDSSITQDQEHLKEHMKDEVNFDRQMSPEEMEFHYFRIHDVNNDTRLDGIEILQAMSHMVPPPELQFHEKVGKSKEQIEALMEQRRKGMMKYYEDLIDAVLREDDIDGDGYVSYPEYVRARRRDERIHHQRMQQEQHMAQQQQFQNEQQFREFQQWQQQQQQTKQAQGQQGQAVQYQGQGHQQQGGQQQYNQQQGHTR